MCFPLFLIVAYFYHKTERMKKGKLLIKVRASPLDAAGKDARKLIFAFFIIGLLVGVSFAFLSPPPSFVSFLVVFLVLPLILR